MWYSSCFLIQDGASENYYPFVISCHAGYTLRPMACLTALLKIQVEVAGQLITFEPDEAGTYRAVMEATNGREEVKIDAALLKAIAQVIESVVQ